MAPSFAQSEMAPYCQGRGELNAAAFTNFLRYWNCGKQIGVRGDSALVSQAIAEWNAALMPDSFPGLPRFKYVPSGGDIEIRLEGSGSGLYCGDTHVLDGGYVRLMGYVQGVTCPTNRASAGTALRHELGHVLGYQSGAHKTPPEGCAFRLPDDGTINGTVCQHEVEAVYYAYSFREIDWNTSGFWSTPIVTGLTTNPAAVTVAKGSTQQVAVTHFVFARQDGADPVPVGSATFYWDSKNRNVARVSSSGLVTGVEGGTTWLQIRSWTNFPAHYQLGARFGGWGHEIPVSVTAPPPPPPGPFKVLDITGLIPPATEAGSYGLSAVVDGQPTGTLKVRWQVTYSNDSLGPFDTGYVLNSYALQVPAGSYNIRVTATPRSYEGTSYVQGFAAIRDFPVCTGGGGGGGGQYAASVPGGADPDAVQGC